MDKWLEYARAHFADLEARVAELETALDVRRRHLKEAEKELRGWAGQRDALRKFLSAVDDPSQFTEIPF